MTDMTIAEVGAWRDKRKAAQGARACDACPIHAACAGGVGALTQQSLDAWRARCVAALERAEGVGRG